MIRDDAFDTLPFPVFSASPAGQIVYKNHPAIRHIGPLRRNARVLRYLLSDSLPSRSELVYLKGETPYPHALMIRDDTEMLFLCPARLQYPDAEELSDMILHTVGQTPDAYREILSPFHTPHIMEDHPRLYAEMKKLSPRLRPLEEKVYHIGDVAKRLFESAASKFCSLGYRILTEIDDDFSHSHPVGIPRFDLFFYFGLILCTMMNLSETRDICLTLTSDTEKNVHLFEIKTRAKSSALQKSLSVFDLFLGELPAYMAELSLLGKAYALFSHASVGTDLRGELTLTFSIPHLPAVLPVQSPAMGEEERLLFHRLFSQMEAQLKGNFSSY